MPTTRDRLRELVQAEPLLNMSQLAARLGVSRERVRQLVRQEGLAVPKGHVGLTPTPRRPPTPRVITGGVPVRLSATIVGTIGEMLAAADLMARGFMVFFPLTRTGACDLITLARHGATERIEVRCGHRNGDRLVWGQADRSRSDRRAIVLTGEPVRYEPPFEGDTG